MRADDKAIVGDTSAKRLIGLLEVIAVKSRFFSVQELVDEIGVPKPTLQRMVQQLESLGMLQRDGDGRHFGNGRRLLTLSENILTSYAQHPERHAVLQRLVDELGETCNVTALSGSEVLYLDRVETTAPLRFDLYRGSRVPVHCSASGKLFLTQMTPAQRRRLLAHRPLDRFTASTITDLTRLEAEIERVGRDRYALDDEEYLAGLICVAVLVPADDGPSNLALAVQVPVMRMTPEKSLQFLPALQRAAAALAELEAGPSGAVGLSA